MKVQNLNQWTTRAVPTLFLIVEFLVFRWEDSHLEHTLCPLAFLAGGQWAYHVHFLESVHEGRRHALLNGSLDYG